MFEEDTRQYNVVVNHEEQYSIWFADRELPLGWRIVDIPAEWLEKYHSEREMPPASNKQLCLDYIEETWVDMRPLSLRQHMQRQAVSS